MVTGASTVSVPAAASLPLNRRRRRKFSGYSRNARKAAQVMGPMKGTKIRISA